MKVCIVGAGAIGGFIGARLAMAGARRQRVRARRHAWPRCASTAGACARAAGARRPGARVAIARADLGAQDLVIIAVKGQSLPGVAPQHRAAARSRTRWCCRR